MESPPTSTYVVVSEYNAISPRLKANCFMPSVESEGYPPLPHIPIKRVALLSNPDACQRTESYGTPVTENGQILVWDNDNQYFDFTANINTINSGEVNVISTNTLLTDAAATVYSSTSGIVITFDATPTTGVAYIIINDSSGSIALNGNGNLIVDSPTQTIFAGESLSFVFLNNKWNLK